MCVLCDTAETITDHPFALDTTKPSAFECLTCQGHLSAHADKLEWIRTWRDEQVAKCGHVITGVTPTVNDKMLCPVAYTAGRAARGLPELVVTGWLDQQTAAALLNLVAKAAEDGTITLRDGEDFFLPSDPGQATSPVLRCRTVPDLMDAQMFAALDAYPNARAVQILYTIQDDQGSEHFPGEAGFDEDYWYPVLADGEKIEAASVALLVGGRLPEDYDRASDNSDTVLLAGQCECKLVRFTSAALTVGAGDRTMKRVVTCVDHATDLMESLA